MEDSKLARLIKERAKDMPIEEVRKITAKIKPSLSEQIIREREEE